MLFKNWIKWVLNQQWPFKWFIVFILIRPITDTLYFLKDISPLISPPNILAVLTPLFVVLSLLFGKYKNKKTCFSYIDLIMIFWGILVFLNAIVILTEMDLISGLELFLRMTIPFILYLYARFYVRTFENLYYLLLTVLFVSVIPAAILLFEIFVNPLGIQYTRGTIVRYHGLYADVFNYGIYSIFAIVTAGFLFLGPGSFKTGKLLSYKGFSIIVLMVIITLVTIAHTTSIIIFICIITLMMLTSFRKNFIKFASITFVIISVVSIFFSDDVMNIVKPLSEREATVISGDRDLRQLGHGRLGRIIDHQEIWQEQSSFAKVIGMSFSTETNKSYWMGGMIHNEYFRSLYTSGILGMIFYILVLLIAFLKAARFPTTERFLFYSLIVIVALYSVTMLPMLYYNLLYIFIPALAFLAHTSGKSKKQIVKYIHER